MDPVGRESRSRAHLVENLAARRALVLMLEDRARALAEPRGMRPLIAHCHLGLGRLYPHWKREPGREHLTTATTMYRVMGAAVKSCAPAMTQSWPLTPPGKPCARR